MSFCSIGHAWYDFANQEDQKAGFALFAQVFESKNIVYLTQVWCIAKSC